MKLSAYQRQIKRYVIYSQEWNPSDVLDESRDESLMTQPILEYRVRKVATDRENEEDTEPDSETLHIECVNGGCPTDNEVVEE
jgi:hypothetical protein